MKTLTLLLIFVSIIACQEEEPFRYAQEQDGVYFKDQSVGRNFAEMMVKVGGKDTYIGDSLRADTVSVPIRLLGNRADYRREIFFKFQPLEGQDSSRLANVELLSKCVLDSAKAEAKVRIILHRPEERQEDFAIGLTFDYDKMEFEPGVTEKQIYQIVLKDKYTKPVEWDDFFITYLGAWSASKHAFVLTYFQKKDIPGYKSPLAWTRMYYPNLKAALEEYNAAHPDNPKDFTLPEL